MTYIRLGINGALAATGEVWSINPCFNVSTESAYTQTELQAAATGVAAVDVPVTWKQSIGTDAKINRMRVEWRSDDHDLLGVAEAPETGWAAGTYGAKMPPQSSAVISLRSDVPGGRGRGRLYLPLMGATISTSTYRLSSPTPAALAADSATYLRGIQDALKAALSPAPSLITFKLCVVSRANGNRVDINRIQVGDVVDTQRRRRDRLQETYSSVAFP